MGQQHSSRVLLGSDWTVEVMQAAGLLQVWAE